MTKKSALSCVDHPIIPFITVCLLLFLTVFLLTAFTPMVSDDYPYSFNWADWTRIESLSDIIESMAVHRIRTNGRVFAHSLVQLFLFMPRIIFSLINAANGLLLCILCHRLTPCERWQDNVAIHLFGIFFVSCFTVALGENYFWLDGSINYSWGIGFSMLFLMPFFLDYLSIPYEDGRVCNALRCLLAVWVGGYAESLSPVVLAMAGILWIMNWIRNSRCNWRFLLWLIFGVLGYCFLMSAPATASRSNSLSFAALGYNIREVFRIAHDDLLWCYLIYAVLLSLAIWFHAEREKLVLSLIIFIGSLISLASYTFAAYIEPRHLCFPVFFMMLASVLLLSSLCKKGKAVFSRLLLACLCVLFLLQFPVGVLDVAVSYHKQQIRLQQIELALTSGETSITLENYYPYTKYAIRFEMNKTRPDFGPNVNIADYYGLKEVYGVDP